jgi:hypothetical protein
MKDSKFLSLGLKDALKGLVIAILTPVFVVIQQSLEAGSLVFEWKTILLAALAGGVAYLTKNFFTSSDKKESNIVGGRPNER